MTSEPAPDRHPKPHHDRSADAELQLDILAGRQFSLADVIGREGSDFMKGESPVPPLMQAIAALNLFISKYLPDSSGALHAILYNWVKSEEGRVSRHVNDPLVALGEIIEQILRNSYGYYEFVRQVDSKWGEMNDERPHFQQPGQAPHPDDEYTHESVRQQLTEFLGVIHQTLEEAALEAESLQDAASEQDTLE
ncbi:MAG: hypothetical protein WBA57_07000 [Elainellaceae cyanobacterium]